MATPISYHFALDEFTCHDGTPYPDQWVADRLTPLCRDVLEVIRAGCDGRPISVVSGYRSPEHNAAVGGAAHSQHMEGRAADIRVEGMAPSDVHKIVLFLLGAGKLTALGGLGVYPNWIHVDVRPRPADGHLSQWTGGQIGDEVA